MPPKKTRAGRGRKLTTRLKTTTFQKKPPVMIQRLAWTVCWFAWWFGWEAIRHALLSAQRRCSDVQSALADSSTLAPTAPTVPGAREKLELLAGLLVRAPNCCKDKEKDQIKRRKTVKNRTTTPGFLVPPGSLYSGNWNPLRSTTIPTGTVVDHSNQ